MISPYFLKMIQTLREKEEIMLYGNILKISETEAKEVVDFLKTEYQKESLEYAFTLPPYNSEAALWAAKTIYIASQLIMYRENKGEEIEILLPDFIGEQNASSLFSVDLCLRFLPDMITQLRLIDSEDMLIDLLELKLYTWHYSGVTYPLNIEKLSFETVVSDPCLHQAYANRIMKHKKLKLATQESFKNLILANLGDHGQEFWKEFKIEISIHE
jgi:hypothetical protein